MDKSEFFSRRALFNTGSVATAGLLVATALDAAPAHAQEEECPCPPPVFTYKSLVDYGVSLTSTADQTTAIQSALSGLGNNDCLVFPPGTYTVAAGTLNITSKKNIRILAYGAVLKVSGGSGDVLLLNSARDINIEGLLITSASTSSGSGIVLTNSWRIALREVNIWNMGDYCLKATRSWWLSTQNCQFLAAGIASAYHATDMNAIIHSGTRFSPYAFASTGNPYNPGATGVVHNGGNAVSFINCDFTNCQVGANLEASNNVTFQNCYFEDVATGISLGHTTGGNFYANNTTVDNCYFKLADSTHATPVIALNISRAVSVLIRNNYVLTLQFGANSKTINYDSAINSGNSKPYNENVVIEANRYVDQVNNGRAEVFKDAISYSTANTNKIKTYSLVDA